ncbi:MAG: NAD(P)-dependent oxidoreductase [Chthoniobacterales bacterium]
MDTCLKQSYKDEALEEKNKARILSVFSSEEYREFFSETPDWAEIGKYADVLTHDVATSHDEWIALLREVRPEVIMGAWSLPPLTEEIVEALPELRYLCYFCGSVRKKIPRSFLERGGLVTNWGEVAAFSVAECALLLILGCLRRANHYFLEMKCEKTWKATAVRPGESLKNKRIGIHGVGVVARKLAALLAPFEVQLQAWSALVPDEIYSANGFQKARSLEGLFADNDVIVEAEGLAPETLGSVNAKVLENLEAGKVFVNIARGKVVDEAALVSLAQSREVFIGLDVYENEPLPATSPLRTLRNVLLFPHVAGPTKDHYPQITRNAFSNLKTYLKTGMPPNSLTPEHYDRCT